MVHAIYPQTYISTSLLGKPRKTANQNK